MNGKKVMRYNWNNSQFTYQEDMNHGHQYAACTVFNSPKHGNFIINKLFRFFFKISLFSKKVTDLSFMLEVDGNLETMQNCWTTLSPIHGSKVIIYLQVANSSMSWLVACLISSPSYQA